ncbi:hypothetical protein KIN20_016708 [Parelaphostrongylus tenuis]|uniref:Globin domain-containing protein n=1 Tax=Parelaphostrongylus tenuis TaxID=148309 RepID=A0AAD5N1P1_PARTN|nr:hypothetical protein KIN20_016708 [Parelaphostrongylus tenuis]
MEWYPFNEEEKAELLRSWKVIEPQKQAVGCDIYEMIFNQCPEIRNLFPKLKFVNSKPDKKSCEFTFQALRFIQVIEGAVMSLDYLSALDPILTNLGRRHGKLETSGKFRSHYWTTFLECSIHIFRRTLTQSHKYPDKDIDMAITLWRYLIQDVVNKIKIGYDVDIKNRLTSLAMDDNHCPSVSIKQRRYSSDSLRDISRDYPAVTCVFSLSRNLNSVRFGTVVAPGIYRCFVFQDLYSQKVCAISVNTSLAKVITVNEKWIFSGVSVVLKVLGTRQTKSSKFTFKSIRFKGQSHHLLSPNRADSLVVSRQPERRSTPSAAVITWIAAIGPCLSKSPHLVLLQDCSRVYVANLIKSKLTELA